MLIPASLIQRPRPKSRELRSLHIWRQKNTLDCQVFEVTWLRTPVRDEWTMGQTRFVVTALHGPILWKCFSELNVSSSSL
jgi:hypothetical protein